MEQDHVDQFARPAADLRSRRGIVRLFGGVLAAGGALGGAIASGRAAPHSKHDAAKKKGKGHKCPKCRRCGKQCCPNGQQCAGGCVTPCASGGCGDFPAACSLFPADNVWRARVDALDLDANSAAYVASIGASAGLHPDFGSGGIGIPFIAIDGGVTPVDVAFEFADESDPGPYPLPPDAPIEAGPCDNGDRHVLVVDAGTCTLYELFDATPRADGSWTAGSGAIFHLDANALRPSGWTSADAAGLPILPGLVRFDEVAAGEIAHALRFTAPLTRDAFVWPARHSASSSDDANLPPLGQRFRLRADFDLSGFSDPNRVILTALQRYGMFLADNGSAWFLSGAPDDRWDNDDLHALQTGVLGSDFEAVDESSLQVDPDSGQVR
ncbi:MAG TPA: hypothetical protein VFQ80_05610 [Thermomicrobiales bacterium]|nr:hypothetical protein [Thermomicrobiales bacterium]